MEPRAARGADEAIGGFGPGRAKPGQVGALWVICGKIGNLQKLTLGRSHESSYHYYVGLRWITLGFALQSSRALDLSPLRKTSACPGRRFLLYPANRRAERALEATRLAAAEQGGRLPANDS